MPSPFPGMDPYLEDPAFWADFHRRFITYCCDAILESLPDNYEARIDEKVRVVVPDQSDSRYYPDVGVTHDPGASRSSSTPSSAMAVALEPVFMTQLEEVRDVWMEVLHRPDRNLVTVIEVLSPSNKVGAGLQDYTSRRDEFLHQDVNFVEVNLLVGGQRPAIATPWPPSDYYVLIARGVQHPRASLIRWNVRDALPTIPVPLLPPDPDVPLALQRVFDTAYDRGRYARSLHYSRPARASFQSDDVDWISERARGTFSGR